MNNKIVEHIYKKHDTWLRKCCYNMTQSEESCNELVQDLYLRLLEMPNIDKIRFNNDINLYYLYKMLKTSFLGREKNKKYFIDIDTIVDDIADQEYNNHKDKLLTIAETELGPSGSLSWFEKKLFLVYHEEEHSLTSLSQATKISRSACYNSISKTKRYIRDKAKQKKLL